MDYAKGLLGTLIFLAVVGGRVYMRWDRDENRQEVRAFEEAIAEADRRIEAERAAAATHLANATVKVVNVFPYAGPSYWTEVLDDDERLLALYTQFENVGAGFNFFYLEMIDPATGEVCDNAPDIIGMKPDSSGYLPAAQWPPAPGQFRCLLVFAAPKTTQSVRLRYWDAELGEGPAKVNDAAKLPFQPKAEEVILSDASHPMIRPPVD